MKLEDECSEGFMHYRVHDCCLPWTSSLNSGASTFRYIDYRPTRLLDLLFNKKNNKCQCYKLSDPEATVKDINLPQSPSPNRIGESTINDDSIVGPQILHYIVIHENYCFIFTGIYSTDAANECLI